MNRPAVSICVPTYNGAAFLSETIESALAQTFQDFELIVLDDASTDATPDVVGRFTDCRLHYIRRVQNVGVSSAWNDSVRLAKAPLVKLLCHDDLLEPTCLARQVPLLANPGVALVSCWRRVISSTGRKLITRRGMESGTNIGRHQAVSSMVRTGTNTIGEPSATLFRKKQWQVEGGFSGGNLYMIDIDMWLRLLKHGSLTFVPEVLCNFRVSPTALSTVLAKKQIASGMHFMAELTRDKANGLTWADLALGVTRATARSLARQMVYNTTVVR